MRSSFSEISCMMSSTWFTCTLHTYFFSFLFAPLFLRQRTGLVLALMRPVRMSRTAVRSRRLPGTDTLPAAVCSCTRAHSEGRLASVSGHRRSSVPVKVPASLWQADVGYRTERAMSEFSGAEIPLPRVPVVDYLAQCQQCLLCTQSVRGRRRWRLSRLIAQSDHPPRRGLPRCDSGRQMTEWSTRGTRPMKRAIDRAMRRQSQSGH